MEQLRVPNLLGGALAAISGAVVASLFGTLAGAGVMSVFVAVATAGYAHSLAATHRWLRRTLRRRAAAHTEAGGRLPGRSAGRGWRWPQRSCSRWPWGRSRRWRRRPGGRLPAYSAAGHGRGRARRWAWSWVRRAGRRRELPGRRAPPPPCRQHRRPRPRRSGLPPRPRRQRPCPAPRPPLRRRPPAPARRPRRPSGAE
jgi:hypothetical protein